MDTITMTRAGFYACLTRDQDNEFTVDNDAVRGFVRRWRVLCELTLHDLVGEMHWLIAQHVHRLEPREVVHGWMMVHAALVDEARRQIAAVASDQALAA